MYHYYFTLNLAPLVLLYSHEFRGKFALQSIQPWGIKNGKIRISNAKSAGGSGSPFGGSGRAAARSRAPRSSKHSLREESRQLCPNPTSGPSERLRSYPKFSSTRLHDYYSHLKLAPLLQDTKDKCTFADTCHTKCMVIAFLRIRFWTCMVAALTLDPIFSLSQSGNMEAGPMPVLTPDFWVSSRPHGHEADRPCQ